MKGIEELILLSADQDGFIPQPPSGRRNYEVILQLLQRMVNDGRVAYTIASGKGVYFLTDLGKTQKSQLQRAATARLTAKVLGAK